MTIPTSSTTAVPASPWRLRGERRRLARAVAREVVTEVAAGELPLFEQRARGHFRPRLGKRRPLSVDVLGLAAEVVTPAALSAAAGVIGVMSAELVSRLTSRAVGRVTRRWRPPELAPAASADPAPAPTATELARWRTAALSGARRHLSEPRAEQVADSVLAELVRMLAADAAPASSTQPAATDGGADAGGGAATDAAADAGGGADGEADTGTDPGAGGSAATGS
ncbi:hypothetical protein ABZT08_06765 [Streptomyces sp. NPDC005526]|uniref:hypothetical protein n=1 Tax=Streptomyces sp. NPDC005526 TaxID=3156885 RepID=UPI0033B86B6E